MGRHSRKVLVYNAVMQQIDEFESAEASSNRVGLRTYICALCLQEGHYKSLPCKKIRV